MKYWIVHGKHSRIENGERVRYRPGDVFEPTDKELAAFGDKLAPVEAEEPESNEDEAFPIHKGGGYYELSNGDTVKGKAKAEAAEDELTSEEA